MPTNVRLSSLVPVGLVVEGVTWLDGAMVLSVRASAHESTCPLCGTPSRRVHSRYVRQAADLPCSGRSVRLRFITRRFVCAAPLCRRRIFAERFDPAVLTERARRTTRLDCVVHHLGLALGGRPAAGIAKRLMLPVSNDTLLRVVRRRAERRTSPAEVIGIDDWAIRRNHRYATIVCDLERRQVVALLPDRESATVQAWLADHPQVRIVARDRGGGYGEATTRAAPHVVQVADRWHLMANASAAFLDAVRKSMPAIRTTIGATSIDPDLLTRAERLQYEGYLRREQANGAILALSRDGVGIKEIVRRTAMSRGLVRQVLRGQRNDVFRGRESSLDCHLPFLDGQWTEGCRNGAELWRRLKSQGFRGSLRVVSEWATRRRRAEKTSEQHLHKVPSARTIARLMLTARNHLSRPETVTVAAIEAGIPPLVEARQLVERFHAMIRHKDEADLHPWIAAATSSLVAPFANGIAKDAAAARAAVAMPWSNGQTEGQITRLKLVKRQMYGRGKIDLLEARLIGAA
jgi:transposase